jgi:hypothetical protein
MTKPLRDPRVLAEEAAVAREQARTLHRRAIDEVGKENDTWGARRDAAHREAATTRASADAMQKQANDLYAESNRHAEMAGEQNAYAASIRESNPVEAEDWFENADGLVRVAESVSRRAEIARDAANDLSTKADALEAEVRRIDDEDFSPDYRGREFEQAADLLEDKARLLEEAASQQRDATATVDDPGASSGSLNDARYAQDRADAMEPDYSSIPRSETPGSELMDPYADAVTDPYSAAPDSYGPDSYQNDTDLEEPFDSGFDATTADF